MKERKQKTWAKRLLVAMLSVMMAVTFIPTSLFAFAAEPDATPDDVQNNAQTEAVQNDEPQTQATEATKEDATKDEKASDKEVKADAKFAEGQLKEESDLYKVTVSYGADAKIPADAKLAITEFSEKDKEYKDAKDALVADKDGNSAFSQATKEEQKDLGMAAFDLTIYDKDGKAIEPKGEVSVSVEFKELPEGVDAEALAASMEIQHLNESTGDVVVEKVATVDSKEAAKDKDLGEIDVKEKKETAETDFNVDVFSTFTITWRYDYWGNPGRTVTVHYVDENGRELTIANPNNTHPDLTASSSSPAYLIYDIDGYEYSYTYRNNSNNRIAPMLSKSGQNNWRYTTNITSDNNVNWTELANGDDIYVVYKQKATPTHGGTAVIDADEEWPEGDNAPQFSKTSLNNGDGTNTVSLSIVGGEKPVEESTPADVIVIFDRSGSMKGEDMSPTRLQAAKNATNTMAETLLANSGVRMALISFSNTAQVEQGFTTNLNTFKGKVNALEADGGTNWEYALQLANEMEVREDAATYIVFVTDGDPTFRNSRADETNSNLDMSQNYYRRYNVFGAGNNDNQGYNLAYAIDQVKAIKDENKNFFAIGISNDVTKVRNLTTQGGFAADHAFIASDQAAMEKAFKDITESIKSALGFGDVEITDGITELTHSEMKVYETVDPDSFQYYRWGGEGNKYGADEAHKTEWTTRQTDGCAAASYNEATNTVNWNMGEGFQLEAGVHYVVTFRVWPSQEAYDLVAELNNGNKSYDTLTDEEKAQVVETNQTDEFGNPIYALKTNTDQVSATYSQTSKTGEKVTVSGDTDIEATYHEGTLENMDLESMKLTIKKEFEDDLTGGEDREEEVVLVLKRRAGHQATASDDPFEEYAVPQGGTTSANIVLNEANGWKYELYIAPGFMVDGEVLEHGYDFTVTEPDIDYHYGLIEEIINPMVVGTNTEQGEHNKKDVYYGDGEMLDGETVEEYVDRSLTAVNRVKSGIDIKKVVYDTDGTTEIFPDTEFTITGKLLGPDGQPYTWQDGDDVNNSGAYHKYDKDGNRIIYKGHFADSSNISFTLKAGEYIRFINVPDGCTFEFTESTAGMADQGYEWVNTEAVTQHRTSPGGPFTPDGDVQPDVDGQTASLKGEKTVVGNKQYAVTYSNKRTIPLPEVELVKVDKDNTATKLNGAEFSLFTDAGMENPVTTDGDGNTINIVTGNKEESQGPDGWYSIGKLPAGTYYMYETKAPTGYVLDEETPVIITVTKGSESYSVTATKDGKNVISGPTDGVYTITVDNEPETKDVSGSKTWGDTSWKDLKVVSITVKLMVRLVTETEDMIRPALDEDDNEIEATVSVDQETGEATYTFEGLPKYAQDGTEYIYSIIETAVTDINGTALLAQYDQEYETDKDGNLNVKNTRKVGDLIVKKTVTGLAEADESKLNQITFKVTGPDGFEPVEFSYEDLDETTGEYLIPGVPPGTYTVTESNADIDGYILTTVIAPNSDGTVAIAKNDKKTVEITNKYYHAEGDVELEVTKELTGRDLEAEQFSFELKDSEGTVLQTKQNAADGSVSFDKIEYDQDDAGKTFTYTITEVIPEDVDENNKKDGYTYDDMTVTVTVEVVDNEDGTLTATPAYPKDTEFNNTYEATGTLDFKGLKTLERGDLADQDFEFELIQIVDDNEDVVETVTTEDSEVTVDDEGSSAEFSFEQITFTKKYDPETEGMIDETGGYTYVIREKVPTDAKNADGVTYGMATAEQKEAGGFVKGNYEYDSHEQTIVVTVEDKGDGTLTVTKNPEPSEDGYDAEFTNIKKFTDLKITKKLDAFNTTNADEITLAFRVSGKNSDGTEEFSAAAGLYFTKAEVIAGKPKEVTVYKVPTDLETITVTEVYASNFKPSDGNYTQTAVLNEEGVYEVSFINVHDDNIIYNTGAINIYEKNDVGGYTWPPGTEGNSENSPGDQSKE